MRVMWKRIWNWMVEDTRGLWERPSTLVYSGNLLTELLAAGGEILTDESDPRLFCDQMKAAQAAGLAEWHYIGGPGSTEAKIVLNASGGGRAQTAWQPIGSFDAAGLVRD